MGLCIFVDADDGVGTAPESLYSIGFAVSDSQFLNYRDGEAFTVDIVVVPADVPSGAEEPVAVSAYGFSLTCAGGSVSSLAPANGIGGIYETNGSSIAWNAVSAEGIVFHGYEPVVVATAVITPDSSNTLKIGFEDAPEVVAKNEKLGSAYAGVCELSADRVETVFENASTVSETEKVYTFSDDALHTATETMTKRGKTDGKKFTQTIAKYIYEDQQATITSFTRIKEFDASNDPKESRTDIYNDRGSTVVRQSATLYGTDALTVSWEPDQQTVWVHDTAEGCIAYCCSYTGAGQMTNVVYGEASTAAGAEFSGLKKGAMIGVSILDSFGRPLHKEIEFSMELVQDWTAE